MRIATKVVGFCAVLAVLAPAAALLRGATTDDNQESILIVFKDGRQQSFRVAEIARIEFSASVGPLTAGRAKFLGRWKLGDGTGATFIATLEPDGRARKDRGTNERGTWTVVNGEARIKWDDGWLDVIRKVGGRYKKVAFSPGTSIEDKPSNIADAEYLETQ